MRTGRSAFGSVRGPAPGGARRSSIETWRACRKIVASLLAGFFVASLVHAWETEDADVECPEYPHSETWVLVADLMAVATTPTPMGGGVDLPVVTVEDCGGRLIATLSGFESGVVFERLEALGGPAL